MGRLMDYFMNKYNYTDFHELNLDWIISDMIKLIEKLDSFISTNTIKYADPIQWNITTQYEANTVVVDAASNTAYLSTKPVPAGISITNTDYWTVVFPLDFLITNHNITMHDDGNNATATFNSSENDWLLWHDVLYKVITPISIGNAYIVDTNIEVYTVEEFFKDCKSSIEAMIGNLEDLKTSDKSSLVSAINENSVARSFVFPEDYGAVGDGITDDFISFKDAIDNVVANNLKLIIPHKEYKLSQYVFTDDDYIIDFGVYPDKKVITSNKMSSGSFKKIASKLLYTADIFGLDHEVQAGLWNEALNCFTLIAWDMVSAPPSHCYITNVDSEFNVISQYDFTYGLFNDACYCSKTNTILATGSNSGSPDWAGKIVELNPSTFAVNATHETDIPVVYEVSYDNENELIYVAGREINDDLHWFISILDTEFNILKTIPIEFDLPGYNEIGLNFNKEGSAFIKNNFLFQSFCDGNLIINSFNLQTGKVKQYYAEPINERYVIENIFVKDNLLYTIGYQGRYSLIIDTYDINTISTNSNWPPEQIIEMKSNVNLNDLEMDSTYVCAGAALTSVVNAPVNQPFIIKTFRLANVYLAQVLITQIGQVYWRGTTTAVRTYTGWKQIAGATNYILYSTDVLYGYMYDNSVLRMSVRLPYIVNGYRASITINRLIIYLEDTVVDLTSGYTVSTPTQTASGLTFNITLDTPVTISHRYQPVCVNLSAAISIIDD